MECKLQLCLLAPTLTIICLSEHDSIVLHNEDMHVLGRDGTLLSSSSTPSPVIHHALGHIYMARMMIIMCRDITGITSASLHCHIWLASYDGPNY